MRTALRSGMGLSGAIDTFVAPALVMMLPARIDPARLTVGARGGGLTGFDVTVGAQPYKSGFNPVERPLFEIAEAATLRGRCALALEPPRSRRRRSVRFERLRRLVRSLRRQRGLKVPDPS